MNKTMQELARTLISLSSKHVLTQTLRGMGRTRKGNPREAERATKEIKIMVNSSIGRIVLDILMKKRLALRRRRRRK